MIGGIEMRTEKGIFIAFILNLFFAVFELFGGFFTNSVAIMSDAIHDFGDALSIGFSFFMERKSRKKADDLYTYGYVRYSLFGATVTSVILLIGSIFVIYNSVLRFIYPEPINYNGMIIFAIVGFTVNLLGAFFTKEGESLNQRAVNLHLLEDVLGWLIVLVGSCLIKITNFVRLDSILSLCVSCFIFWNSLKNFISIVNTMGEKVPAGISVEEIRHHLLEIEDVKGVHHIHIWSLDGEKNNCATLHIVTDGNSVIVKNKVKEELREHGISHITVEIESSNEVCNEKECCVNVEIGGCNHHHHHHHSH